MSVSDFWNNTATHAVAVTPNDTTPIQDAGGKIVSARRLWIGGAGNLTVVMDKNQTITFTGVLAGSTMSIETSYVKSTGTTATNIVALY